MAIFCESDQERAPQETEAELILKDANIFFEFSLTVMAAPHECVIRTGQP